MNKEVLNMQTTDEQATNVSEVQDRPKSFYRKLGAAANTLVARAKKYTGEKKEEMHERVRSKHPEIFDQIDEEAVEALQSGYLERLRKVDWEEVISSYQNAYKVPREFLSQVKLMNEDGVVVDILSKELNIKKELHGYYPDSDSKGSLKSSYISKGLMRKKGLIQLSNDMISYDGVNLMLEHEDYNLENEYAWKGIARVGTIAHEMWHVFQDANNATPGRNKMYQINKKHYVNGEKNYDLYHSQLMEMEANRFENEVERILISQIFPESETDNK